ncbi:phosphoribosyltransferase-like protein, partial [Globomyces pollinis-pini]
FLIPEHYSADLESVLLPYGLIQDRYSICLIYRVEKLAHDIAASVSKPVVACCVLKGAYGFFSNLTDHLKKLKTPTGNTIPLNVEFIKVKSYENDASTGKVKISLTEEELLGFKGKDLLIVEDIVDTGATMVALIDMLKQYSPSSIKVVSLLLKKTSRSNDYVPDFVGFSIPDLFVVGYGLDYNEIFRDLQHIAVLNEHGKKRYSQ